MKKTKCTSDMRMPPRAVKNTEVAIERDARLAIVGSGGAGFKTGEFCFRDLGGGGYHIS